MYGLYAAFVILAMSKGVWVDWYGDNVAGLSVFAITYLLGALGSALNYTWSAGWAILNIGIKGKLADFFRTINTKPGRIMVIAALVGGPISSTAFVVAMQMAGSIVIPITALCPAIGAILARIFYKQKLTKRMMLGIGICVIASFMIGSTFIGGDAPDGLLLGIAIALIAAFGWGFEGCVAGYGTSMIDSEIGITIRQTISGPATMIILIPIFSMLAGDVTLSTTLVAQAIASGSSMFWFAIAGFCAYLSYMLWYRGNGMCGAALGMAGNGTYSFWGPFCCWIILGVIFGMEGWGMPPIAWIAAVMMAIGIWVIAMNPLDLLQKKEG